MGCAPFTLGLDLQGGSNVLLEVDQKDLRDKLSQQLVGDIRSTLREAKIGLQRHQSQRQRRECPHYQA